MKRLLSYVSSQETTLGSQSQSEEMPYVKKSRGSSRRRGTVAKRVPRAIATRGTADGYTEIPVHSYTKIYVTANAGFWDTNQISGAPAASASGPGIGYYTSLDTEYWLIGGFGVYNTIAKTVPGFSQLQGVFDLCKIVDIKQEYWFTYANISSAGVEYAAAADTLRSGGGLDLPELWLTEDTNNANPGNNMDDICQYSRVTCVRANGNHTKFRIKPEIREDIGTAGDESGVTTTLGASRPSTYMVTSRPAGAHLGMRGFLNVSSVNNVPQSGFLHIRTTQLRRYKRSN